MLVIIFHPFVIVLLMNERWIGVKLVWTDSIFWYLQPKLVAVSNIISFVNPKAPVYPRLAQGKSWNEVSLFRRGLVHLV